MPTRTWCCGWPEGFSNRRTDALRQAATGVVWAEVMRHRPSCSTTTKVSIPPVAQGRGRPRRGGLAPVVHVLHALDDGDVGAQEPDLLDLLGGDDVGQWGGERPGHGVSDGVPATHPPTAEVHDDGVVREQAGEAVEVVLLPFGVGDQAVDRLDRRVGRGVVHRLHG